VCEYVFTDRVIRQTCKSHLQQLLSAHEGHCDWPEAGERERNKRTRRKGRAEGPEVERGGVEEQSGARERDM